MQPRESCIAYGESNNILEELEKPQIMAVVWQGVWTSNTLNFADNLAQKPEFNLPASEQILFKDRPELLKSDAPGCKEFLETRERTLRFVQEIAKRLCRSHIENPMDLSRIEPAIGNDFTQNAGPWHVDGGRLIMLSVLSAGPSTEYLPCKIAGQYKGDVSLVFYPSSEKEAENISLPLTRDALLVFKGVHFPDSAEGYRGFVHRRPNAKLTANPLQGRVISSYKI